MMRHVAELAGALILLGSPGLAAGEPARLAKPPSMEAYLTLAAENNPGLKAGFNRYLAALEKVPQMGSLPDPTATFGIFIEPMERYAGDQVGSISLMQMFPWFGTLGAARKEAAQMAKAEYHSFREAKHQLFYEVKSALIDLYMLELEIKVTRKNVETLKSLENIAIIRLSGGGSGSGGGGKSGSGASRQAMPGGGSSGRDAMGGMGAMEGQGGRAGQGSTAGPGGRSGGGQGAGAGGMGGMGSEGAMNGMAGGGSGSTGMADVLWVQMEVKELESGLLSLLDRRQTLTARCNRLLGRNLEEPVTLPENLRAMDLPAAMAESIASGNPMLGMLEAEGQAFAYQEKMNRRMGLPMLGLGVQYDILRSREGGVHGTEGGEGHNMLMPMVSVSLPVWRGKYTAAAKESALQRKAVEARRQDIRNGLQVDQAEIRRAFQDAARRMELYQVQKNLARQALNILTARYSGTGQGFEELLRLQKKELEYEMQWERAVADNNLAVARAERLMGAEPAADKNPDASGRDGSE